MTAHTISWFGVDPSTRERIPRTRHMNGADWGWDATCSCGWDSRTGGAIQQRIIESIADHKWEAAYDEREAEENRVRAAVAAEAADDRQAVRIWHARQVAER